MALVLSNQPAPAGGAARSSAQDDRACHVVIGNTCQPGSTEGTFAWKMFLHAGPGIRDSISKVTLRLHPTFRNNVIVLKTHPFEFSASGWGTFEVGIEMELTLPNGEVTTFVTSHMLSFDSGGASRTEAMAEFAAAVKKAADVAKEAAPVVPTLYDDLKADYPGSEATFCRAMHGRLGDPSWDSPVKVVHCDQEARPGYASRKAHEYNDTPRTLREKVRVLADMVRRSKQMAAYTGAGISTASGIGDYASKAKNSTSKVKKAKRGMHAEPTLAHRVLAAMHGAGYLKHWVQQNHDGLPQKAGFPQGCLNEIHGAWQDPSNPVVPMSGHLRRDLVEWLEEWEQKADMCLVLGTSMCGMAADDFALAVNRRAKRTGNKLGMCVVSIQQTQHDAKSALRIFAKIDEVMALLAEELNAGADEAFVVEPYVPASPIKDPYESVFTVKYNRAGNPSKSKTTVLDLRPGAPVRVTRGVGKGFVGKVRGMTDTGDYVLNIPLQREGHPQRGKKMSSYVLGRWWVQGALEGSANYLPVVNNV